ncbi:MAG: L,D-transpeptidase [Synergistaceae bacterium]|nr:L,D-transpeptidase [Synergistaceae bacterium]
MKLQFWKMTKKRAVKKCARLLLILLLIISFPACAAWPQPLEAVSEEESAAVESLLGGVDEEWLLIRKGEKRLFVVRNGKIVKSCAVATGRNPGQKEKAGDCRTPTGIFSVSQIQKASGWTHDFKDGKGEIKGAYGPWFIRLKTPWRGIGIHGTHDPDSIGKNATEGCIRLRNEELEELKEKYVKISMIVMIRD